MAVSGLTLITVAHHHGKGDSLSILRDIILNIRAGIKQILPAQPCVLCGVMSHDGLWCAICDRALPYLDMPHCPICALPSPAGAVCGQCIKHQPLFNCTTAVFGYAFPLDKLIQAMKYGEQLALAHAFAEKMAQRIKNSNFKQGADGKDNPVSPLRRDRMPDYVIPMPLHPAKLRERGFNQSMLLAAKVVSELGLELLPDVCQRVRNTPPQSALPWKERKKNMRNAFRCDADLTGHHVALVDDVLTTGASLNALAEAVQKRGASEISVWVGADVAAFGGQMIEGRVDISVVTRQVSECGAAATAPPAAASLKAL